MARAAAVAQILLEWTYTFSDPTYIIRAVIIVLSIKICGCSAWTHCTLFNADPEMGNLQEIAWQQAFFGRKTVLCLPRKGNRVKVEPLSSYLITLKNNVVKLNPYPTGKSRVRAVEVVMWHIGKGKSTLAWLDYG